MNMGLKEKFYLAYNKVPLGIRDEPILVINNDSISWRVARLEIDADTPLSKEILEKLSVLKII